MPIAELMIEYRERPTGSSSKLRTYADGCYILGMIVLLVKEHRPLHFFCVIAFALLVAGSGLGAAVILEFMGTGLVPRLPTAVLSTGLVLLSFLLLMSGLILESVARGRKEMKRLAYLSVLSDWGD